MESTLLLFYSLFYLSVLTKYSPWQIISVQSGLAFIIFGGENRDLCWNISVEMLYSLSLLEIYNAC